MRQHSVIHTPKTSDYAELARIWEASVRATHDFLPDSYITLLKNLVLTRYLDAVMLICTKDTRQRITGLGLSPALDLFELRRGLQLRALIIGTKGAGRQRQAECQEGW